MTLTNEERATLQSNIEKIDAYIREEIVPLLHGTSVTVDFGPMETYMRGPMEPAYHLTVTLTGISGRTGGLGLSLLPSEGRNCNEDFVSYNSAGIELLKNWPHIKQTLIEHVQSVQKDYDILKNFQI